MYLRVRNLFVMSGVIYASTTIYSWKPAPLSDQSEGLITFMVDLIEKHWLVVSEHWKLSKLLGLKLDCIAIRSVRDFLD